MTSLIEGPHKVFDDIPGMTDTTTLLVDTNLVAFPIRVIVPNVDLGLPSLPWPFIRDDIQNSSTSSLDPLNNFVEGKNLFSFSICLHLLFHSLSLLSCFLFRCMA